MPFNRPNADLKPIRLAPGINRPQRAITIRKSPGLTPVTDFRPSGRRLIRRSA